MNDNLPYGWEMRALLTRQLPPDFAPDPLAYLDCEHEWSERDFCLYNELHHRCKKCGHIK